MHRWLLGLLMVFLPARFPWVLAAIYGQDEAMTAATGHFAHDEHRNTYDEAAKGTALRLYASVP